MRQQKTYIFKLWNDSNDNSMWRASLEDIQTKEKTYFGSLEAFLAFVETNVEPEAEAYMLSQNV